ncbi:MAG: DUF374 domain-containing protein [Fibrobacterales bacterium]
MHKIAEVLCTTLLKGYLLTLRVSVPRISPAIIALWHQDLPASIAAFKHQSISVQISASPDGSIAHRLCQSLGYTTYKGSSSSLQGSIRSLLKKLHDGGSIGIALDGPRGPAGICNSGAPWLHTQSGTPLYLVTISYQKSLRIRSWDRMHFPLPFSKVVVTLNSVSPVTHSIIQKQFKG